MRFGGTMCVNDDCNLRTTCRRHKDSGTISNEFQQSYSFFQPDKDNYCSYYIKTNNVNY